MRADVRLVIISSLILLLSGLLSDVVAGYLAPAFEGRRWLAVLLLALLCWLGMELALRQQAARSRLQFLLGRDTLADLLELLVPAMRDAQERRGFVLLATAGDATAGSPGRQGDQQPSWVDQIDFSGPAEAFTLNLLDTLLHEAHFEQGKAVLQSLLCEIRDRSGEEQRARFDALIVKTGALSLPTGTRFPQPLLARYLGLRLNPALLLLPLLMLAAWWLSPWVGDVWAQVAPVCPPDRTCLLVAELGSTTESEAAKADAITGEIVDRIQGVLDRIQDERFTVRRAAAVDSTAEALALARQVRAPLVIWGKVSEAIGKYRVEFELVDLLGIGEAQDIRTYRVEPLTYDPLGGGVDCSGCVYGDIETQVQQRADVLASTAVGLLRYVRGQPEEAKADFLAALACAGDRSAAHLGPGEAACAPAAPIDDWDAGLLVYYLGKALLLEGNYANAVQFLQRAADLNPQDPAALIGVGSALQSWLGAADAPEAVDALRSGQRRAEELLPAVRDAEKPSVHFDLAIIAEQLGDPVQAAVHYCEAAKAFGLDRTEAYVSMVGLAHALGTRGDFREGVTRLWNAGDPADPFPEVACSQISTYPADIWLQQAIALAPDAPWAYLELARLTSSDRAAAEDWLAQARGAAPGESYVDVTWAELCAQVWNDASCAQDAYQRALDKRGSSGWLHSRVGDFYRSGADGAPADWQRAEEHYRQALARRACDPWAHQRLAYVLAAGGSGRYAEAAQEYALAVQLLHPATHPQVQEGLAAARQEATVRAIDAGQPVADVQAPEYCQAHP